MTKSGKPLTINGRIKYIVSILKKRGEIPEDAQEPDLNQIAGKRFTPLMQAAFQEYDRRCSALMAAAEEHEDVSSVLSPAVIFANDSAATSWEPLSLAGLSGRINNALSPDQISNDEEFLSVELFGLLYIHLLWEAIPPADRKKVGLQHPYTPLIRSHLKPPKNGNTRKTGILSAALTRNPLKDTPTSTLFDIKAFRKQGVGFNPSPEDQAHLPDFEPANPTQLAPALPLLMYDEARAGKNPGRGSPTTPWELRTWIELILTTPAAERYSSDELCVQYGDFVEWLMPNGRYSKKCFQAIDRALDEVHNLRLPWEIGGVGGLWSVILVISKPRTWNAYNDLLIFKTSLPPGVSGYGPLIYRPALREMGQESVLQYRSYLSLSWMWDHYGANKGRYIQSERVRLARDKNDNLVDAKEAIILDENGKPARTWMIRRKRNKKTIWKPRPGIVPLDADGKPVLSLNDAARERNPAADQYPILTPQQLVALAYMDEQKKLTPATHRKRQERSRKALKAIKSKGLCTIEDIDGGMRILPPPGWGASFDHD